MDEEEVERRRLLARQVRDLCAVVLILAGAVGALVCAFLLDPLAGWAAVSGTSVAVGVALGIDKTS